MTSVRFDLGVASRGVELATTVRGGVTTAVVGPNGAGKSTLVQLIAGAIAPSQGQLWVGDQLLAGPSGVVPPHRRRVGLLAQRPLLFDHLSVLDNVGFGVRARGASRAAARQRAEQELDALGLSQFSPRRPAQLSGGQAQRVALARALATDPDVLLLDEPLAALDVEAAHQMRQLLAARLQGRTVILVTHDPLDLWTLADDVLVLDEGTLAQHGRLLDVAAGPQTQFLAGLLGTNRLLGTATGPDALDLPQGPTVIGVSHPDQPQVAGGPAMALFEPSAVTLWPATATVEGSPRNVWPVQVSAVEPRGSLARVRLTWPTSRAAGADSAPTAPGADSAPTAPGADSAPTGTGVAQHFAAEVTARAVAELGVAAGVELLATVKATQVSLVAQLRP